LKLKTKLGLTKEDIIQFTIWHLHGITYLENFRKVGITTDQWISISGSIFFNYVSIGCFYGHHVCEKNVCC